MSELCKSQDESRVCSRGIHAENSKIAYQLACFSKGRAPSVLKGAQAPVGWSL